MKTRFEIYRMLYTRTFEHLKSQYFSLTVDDCSRRANIFAVKYTNEYYNSQRDYFPPHDYRA